MNIEIKSNNDNKLSSKIIRFIEKSEEYRHLFEESTRKRELAAFDSIRDHNPKFVISSDPEEPVYNGIVCKNVISWLLEN